MTDNNRGKEKDAVEHLSFGAKTVQRVTWEAWSFRIAGPCQVEVTNDSYGYLKDDHRYVVGVEERDGVAVPAECGCKADRFNDDYDCKHKLALATVGGPVVLEAATRFPVESETEDPDSSETTAADKLAPDGGVSGETTHEDEDECACVDWSLPCFECYRTGERAL